MATQPLEHPATAVITPITKDEIAERLVLLGQRVETFAQAVIDANDEIDGRGALDAQVRRKLNFVAWPLLDAAREAGQEIVGLGSKLEALS